MTLCGAIFRERLLSAFAAVVDQSQDFTDSAYTSHENREKILLICDRLKMELDQLLRVGAYLVSNSTHSHLSSWSRGTVILARIKVTLIKMKKYENTECTL